MKISSFILFCSVFFAGACAGVKTRKQAAEEAKNKPAAEAPAMSGPIDEDDDAPVSGVQTPVDDPILDDELAAMGIDPSKNVKAQTPESAAPHRAQPAKKKKKQKKK